MSKIKHQNRREKLKFNPESEMSGRHETVRGLARVANNEALAALHDMGLADKDIDRPLYEEYAQDYETKRLAQELADTEK